MTDNLVHPIPDFESDDIEAREYEGAFGQLETVSLERFYWIHLDWYEQNALLEDEDGIGGFLKNADKSRGTETLENCVRVFVDHYMIPKAIRSGIPPFDEIPEEDRIAMIKDAEAFQS